MIYFTSDLHFNHNKDFLYEPRGFKSVEEMNETIIKNWNKIVTADDDVFILGDVMLGDDTSIKLVKQLNGRLHIIRGNHDSDKRIALYRTCYNVNEICEGKFLKYKKYSFYLSHYPVLSANYDMDKPLYRRMISLCGHVHTNDKFSDMNKGVIYHVELDAHGCCPVSIETIIEDIKAYEERK